MNEINKINLSEQTKFRLNEIIGIENYFHQEINQSKSCSKKLSKYVTAFGYIDKILIGAPAGIASANLTLIFSVTAVIMKKLLSITRNKKEKHDKILTLAKSNLDNIKTLVSQALTDVEVTHEKFNAIIREKQKYERMKKNVKNVSEK